MYKLLIVDDEEFEREGMAEFIPWEQYGVELAGTAWNGIEGYEKIQDLHPDIVMTDIKMPVMNGLELIHKVRKEFPDIEFIVLSGYGEYEFTSKAMEDGVRHYILKPCDEEKIAIVLEKVKSVIEEKRAEKEQVHRQSTEIEKLLPRARKQVFYNMLLGKKQIQAEYQLFMGGLDPTNTKIRILVFEFEKDVDYIEEFIVDNVLSELLGDANRMAVVSIADKVCFMLQNCSMEEIKDAVKTVREILLKLTEKTVLMALSEQKDMTQIRESYLQDEELLRLCALEKYDGVMCYDELREESTIQLIDYHEFSKKQSEEGIFPELYLVFCKMNYLKYTIEQKRKICQGILGILKKDHNELPEQFIEDQELFSYIIDEVVIREVTDKEMKRFLEMKKQIWLHIDSPKLSIKYLAKDVLYMNEDYFGRVFLKYQHDNFSTYVLDQRMELAKELIIYDPDMKLSEIAGMIGFPEDGQYFSRAFKKKTGIAPSDFREMQEH